MAEYLFLVIGSRGEYSDHCEWPVCIYSSKVQADEHARLANDHENGRDLEAELELWTTGKKPPENPWDPGREMFGCSSYATSQVELRRTVPKRRGK